MKLLLLSCYVIFVQIFAISGLPFAYNLDDYRLRRSPHRAIMVSGYYPRGADYEPGSGTTAFLSGETVATNSYVGSRYRPYQEDGEIDSSLAGNNPKHDQQESVTNPPPGADFPEEANVKPDRVPKKKPAKPIPEDEDEEDEENWPLSSRRRGPSYNAFFPIMFGSYGGGSKGRDGGGYPGSATAIANSYSTGRGGVASSHATAYGDPYVNTLLRNGNNFKKKQQVQEEDF